MTTGLSTTGAALILDGKTLAAQLQEDLRARIQARVASGVRSPKLVVIVVGDDPASHVYTKRKATVARELGMLSERIALPADTPQAVLLDTLTQLNADTTVDGILVQMPLPKHLDTQAVLRAVDPTKDVDGFHPINLGRLLAGDLPPALPCTPAGMMTLLQHYNIPIAGQHAVVIGRSTIVGKPMAQLLLNANATVTICHSKTRELPSLVGQADIVVAAIGQPNWVQGSWLKPGAVVLDVGINRLPDGRLVGDVDFERAVSVASAITPVPGGVGPLTIATLMANTVALWELAG